MTHNLSAPHSTDVVPCSITRSTSDGGRRCRALNFTGRTSDSESERSECQHRGDETKAFGKSLAKLLDFVDSFRITISIVQKNRSIRNMNKNVTAFPVVVVAAFSMV